jgi:cyclin A
LVVADDSEAKFLAQYLAELTLLDGQTYLHFIPSVIGAASVALARHTVGLTAWDSAMVNKTGLRIEDFKECLIFLHETFSNAAEYPQQAVREKYKHEK